jgi:ribosomal protein L29
MEARPGYRPSLHILSPHYSQPTFHYTPLHEACPAYSHPSKQTSVFDRLYQHHSMQMTDRDSRTIAAYAVPRRVGKAGSPPKIAEELYRKDRQSKEQIMALRTKYMNDELGTLRATPRINATSRKIIARVRTSSQAQSVPSASHMDPVSPYERAEPMEEDGPRVRIVSPAAVPQTQPSPARLLSPNEANMVKALMLHGKLAISPAGGNRAGDEVKRVTLQSLREEVMTRFKGLEPDVPPDYFSLPFDSRNRVFLEHRSQKIQETRDRERAKEVQECTFRPVIYTRVPHSALNRSASQLLHFSQDRTPRSLSRTRRSDSAPRSKSYYEQYQRRVQIEALRTQS